MDTSARCTCARAALTEDERGRLMKEGCCFNCKNTGPEVGNVLVIKIETKSRQGKQKRPPKIRKKPLVL